MYHTFVRRLIRRAYGLISAGRLDELVAQFAPNAVFSFSGQHVLGGEFRGPDAVRAWFTEVRRLFPDFRLEPRRILRMLRPSTHLRERGSCVGWQR